MDELAELKARVAALEGEALGPVLGPMPHYQERTNSLIDAVACGELRLHRDTRTTPEAKAALAASEESARRARRLAVAKERLAYLRRPGAQLIDRDRKELADLEREVDEH